MSNSKYNSLEELNAGSYNWKIKVRILRNWKGVSSSSDGWKGINILLLDDKVRSSIHTNNAKFFISLLICVYK